MGATVLNRSHNGSVKALYDIKILCALLNTIDLFKSYCFFFVVFQIEEDKHFYCFSIKVNWCLSDLDFFNEIAFNVTLTSALDFLDFHWLSFKSS